MIEFLRDDPKRSKRLGNEIYVNSGQANFIPESIIWSRLNLNCVDDSLHLLSVGQNFFRTISFGLECNGLFRDLDCKSKAKGIIDSVIGDYK